MISTKVFVLWDENDGYRIGKIYMDNESATIGLQEHYTEHWIVNKKAKIEEVDLVSYIEKN